jgi:hypothetical protein
MPAGKYNLEIEQGATFTKSFTVKQPGGTPVDLTGYTVRMMARANYDDPAPLITLSTISPPAGITLTDPDGGQFQIALTAAQTAALNFSKILYDLEIVSGAGVVTRLLEGSVTLIKEVTK